MIAVYAIAIVGTMGIVAVFIVYDTARTRRRMTRAAAPVARHRRP